MSKTAYTFVVPVRMTLKVRPGPGSEELNDSNEWNDLELYGMIWNRPGLDLDQHWNLTT